MNQVAMQEHGSEKSGKNVEISAVSYIAGNQPISVYGRFEIARGVTEEVREP